MSADLSPSTLVTEKRGEDLPSDLDPGRRRFCNKLNFTSVKNLFRFSSRDVTLLLFQGTLVPSHPTVPGATGRTGTHMGLYT